MTFGLPHVHFLDIPGCFAFDIIEQAPESDALTQYLTYLSNTYITSFSMFPPHLWATTDIDSKRTTNGCESFHKHLNSLFYHAHPSIFELVERLQEIMQESRIKLQSCDIKRPQNAKDRKKKEWISYISSSFAAGTMTRIQYLKSVCHVSLPLTTL